MGTTTSSGTRPRNRVFRVLRDLWLAAEDGRTSVKLGELLGVSKQKISTFASSTDGGRVPPWSMVLRLAAELDRELRISRDGIVVTRVNRSAQGGLFVGEGDHLVTLDPADLVGDMPL